VPEAAARDRASPNAGLRTLQLAQQMPQAINLRKGMIALYDPGAALGTVSQSSGS